MVLLPLVLLLLVILPKLAIKKSSRVIIRLCKDSRWFDVVPGQKKTGSRVRRFSLVNSELLRTRKPACCCHPNAISVAKPISSESRNP